MREKLLTYTSAGFSSCGLALSVQDVESYLNIVLIVISVMILLINCGLRLYDRLKDKKLTPEEVKETVDDLNNLSEEIKKKGGR